MRALVCCARRLGWVANGWSAERFFSTAGPIRDSFRNSRTRADERALSEKMRIPDRRKDCLNHKSKQKEVPGRQRSAPNPPITRMAPRE